MVSPEGGSSTDGSVFSSDQLSKEDGGCIDGTAFLDPLNERPLTWAINSIIPFKSPGPDDIIPAQLQRTVKVSYSFYASVRLRHIPRSWRQIKVGFIPKAGN